MLVLPGSVAAVATAATVTVTVPGPLDPKGTIGCGLFAAERGFPLDENAALVQWRPALADGVTCVFRDVADGVYAVSVLVDMNGNHRVDTNALGMPQEPWGVSNDARPSLRPPRFDEAAFKVRGGGPVALSIYVKQ